MDKEKKGRQYQDTVFRMYFNKEARLKEVAGALHGRSYEEEPLKIVTLEGTFLSQIKNGISFLLAGRHLIFMKHQSTANQNMPLRCLYYVCEQLRQYIPAKKLYQNTPIKLPAPEFHVFYTGNNDMPETCQMKLSDAYVKTDEEIHLELKVNSTTSPMTMRKYSCKEVGRSTTTASSLLESKEIWQRVWREHKQSAKPCDTVKKVTS